MTDPKIPAPEPVAWIGPIWQVMDNHLYEAWAEKYPGDGAEHFKPCCTIESAETYAAAREAAARMAEREQCQIELREWAVQRWHAEVENRPLVNHNRRPLDDCWRQVMRYAGLDAEEAVGPSHDALLFEDRMPACQAKLLVNHDGRGRPKLGALCIQVCGQNAVIKTPRGFFDDGRQVWFCRLHAPMKLLHHGEVTAKG
jgi:hypothetical protein